MGLRFRRVKMKVVLNHRVSKDVAREPKSDATQLAGKVLIII